MNKRLKCCLFRDPHCAGTAAALIFCLVSSPVAHAGDIDTAQRDEDDSIHLQSYRQNMSPEDYRDAYRENRRELRDFAVSYAERAAESWGTPRAVMKGIGFAAAAALQNEGSLSLGDSDILELEFQDAMDSDRALLLKARYRW